MLPRISTEEAVSEIGKISGLLMGNNTSPFQSEGNSLCRRIESTLFTFCFCIRQSAQGEKDL